MARACDIPCLRRLDADLGHWLTPWAWYRERLELPQSPLLQQPQTSASPSTGDQLRGETKTAQSSQEENVCHSIGEEIDMGVPGDPHTQILVFSPLGRPVEGAGFVELIWGLVGWGDFEMTGDIDLK